MQNLEALELFSSLLVHSQVWVLIVTFLKKKLVKCQFGDWLPLALDLHPSNSFGKAGGIVHGPPAGFLHIPSPHLPYMQNQFCPPVPQSWACSCGMIYVKCYEEDGERKWVKICQHPPMPTMMWVKPLQPQIVPDC